MLFRKLSQHREALAEFVLRKQVCRYWSESDEWQGSEGLFKEFVKRLPKEKYSMNYSVLVLDERFGA